MSELERTKEILRKIYFYSGVAGYIPDDWCEEVRQVLGLATPIHNNQSE